MKKKFLIIGAVLLIIIIVIILFATRKNKIESYKKYNMKSSVFVTKKEEKQNLSLDINFDGQNAKISSSKSNDTIYLSDNTVYYPEDDTLYTYKIDSPSNDISKLLLNIKEYDKVEEHSNIASYHALLDAESINKILKSLFINTEVDKSYVITFVTIDGYIKSLNMSLENTSNFDKLDISIKFDKLDDDYTIDTSAILGLRDGRIKYFNIEEAKDNPLEIK